MVETFSVDCPGCGEAKGPITTNPGTVGIHCSCGVTSTVDVEAQVIDTWEKRSS